MTATIRSIRPPLDAREWLEDMRCFNGRDADFATEVLAMLDAHDGAEEELTRLSERLGDFDDAADILEWAYKLQALRDDPNGLGSEVQGDDPHQAFVNLVTYAEGLEAQLFSLRDLARQADLIGPKDETTDIVPLIAMFLPIEGPAS